MSRALIFVGLLAMLPVAVSLAAKPIEYEDDDLLLRFYPRTPDQMSAFYEARGFPAAMISLLRDYCFITVGLRNKGRDVLWLDLADWRFSDAAGTVERIPRSAWPPRWQAMAVPLSSQSTFRWTLLPEVLDFQPDEREGGNVILVPPAGKFSVAARFVRGADRQGRVLQVRVDGLYCARDEAP